MNAMIVKPIGTIATAASAQGRREPGQRERDADRDRPPRETSQFADAAERLAIVIAPRNDPTPASADSMPNVPASPSNVPSASSGTNTAKLNANVNTIAIAIRGRRRSSVRHTYFRPATRCPRSRVLFFCGWSSPVRIISSAVSTAM